MGCIDEAMTEWQVAFDVPHNDARTANRLSLTLDRAKRYEGSASCDPQGARFCSGCRLQLRKRFESDWHA